MSEATETIQLNAAQREAVEHLHGPLLVIAGAGTGKTRVITERILYLLESVPDLTGENILAVTYTNKAAGEMTSRIRRAGGQRAGQVEVHTFHDFCYQLLKTHSETLQLLDETDYWIFLRRRLAQLGLEQFKKASDPGRFISDFIRFFSRCQDELVSPADYNNYVAALEKSYQQEKNLLNEEERAERESEVLRQQEIARVYSTAERLLQEANRTTFGGSMISAVHLLEENEGVRNHYQEKFRYIVVDEFQDTNITQIRLLELLAGRHGNIMVVGDDDQAIYRFRGASYASFRRFAELFPGHTRIALSQNYRSAPPILQVAGELIAQNGPARFDPDKRLTPTRPGKEPVRLAEMETAADEAAYVRGEIERLYQEKKKYRGIAVLYRAHTQRNALVDELVRAGIPFTIRNLSILSTTLVRDLLAYLHAIHSPRDNISLARLLAIPAWKFSPELLRGLIAFARKEKVSLARAAESLHPSVRDEETRLGPLLKLLGELRPLAREFPLAKLFDALAERTGLQMLPHDPDRVYLETFVEFLHEWEQKKSETKRLAEFIEYLGYFEEAGGSVNLPGESAEQDAVQLMTVHAAKGLEFNSVFVLRLNRNDFPTKRRTPLFEFPEELMKEALPSGDVLVQEERRLCYVAFTRARQRLLLSTLTGKRKHPSVFLEDILRQPKIAAKIRQFEPRLPAEQAAPAAAPAKKQSVLFGRSPEMALYSRIAEWASDAANSEVAEPLSLNPSSLDTYDRCPLKYKFAHLWNLRGLPTPALIFGSIMHRTLAEYFRARQLQPDLSQEELLHIYEVQWEATGWPFPDEYQREEYFTGGREQLQTFHEKLAGQNIRVLEMEKTFEWNWEDIVLTGRIDQINKIEGRKVEIVEFKTGAPQPPKKIEKSQQLALYALAAEHQLQYQPEKLTLYNLTSNEPHSFEPAEKTLTKALEGVRAAAANIRAGEFAPKPNFFCRSCEYRTICPAQEQDFTLEMKEQAEGNSGDN